MGWWDRVVAVFKREAADVREGMAQAGASLDAALERKQRELDATPQERVDMILDEIDEADNRFEDLESKVRDQLAAGAADAEVGEATAEITDDPSGEADAEPNGA